VRHYGSPPTGLVAVLGFVLTTSVGIAQQGPAVASQAGVASGAALHSPAPDTDKVSLDAPVITLDGFCAAPPTGATDKTHCRTAITRSEFEKLTDASQIPATVGKVQFAAFYIRFALLAQEAQKQGLDKDPKFQTRLELTRIQLLGQMLLQELQAKAGHFAPGDLEKFFRENPAQFEQAELLRIYIPRTRFRDLPNGIQQPMPETAAEMKLAAGSIYSRALAGGDFETLQQEASNTANLKDEQSTKLGKMARDHLRRSQQGVFDLKPGEVSTLFEEPDEGYYIYKIVSKEMPAFESVKSDVAIALEKYRMDTWMKNITESAQVSMNEQFFGTSSLPKDGQDH
jgi:hypothetical protein